MTIEEYFEKLKEHRKGKTPYGFDTAKDFERLFEFIENYIKEQDLTVEQYMFICENLEKFRDIKIIHGIEHFEQWKRITTKNG